MSALAEFQRAFHAFLAAADAPDRAPPAGFTPATAARAGIHRNTIHSARQEALRTTYPAVSALVGEACFDSLASRFARSDAPDGPVLAEYGAGFAGFLERQDELGALVWLGDVARLEWLVNEVRQAAVTNGLSADAARALFAAGDGDLRLAPLPGLRLLQSAWPVAAIREAARDSDGAALEALASATARLAVRPGPEGPSVLSLEAGPFLLLRALDAGEAFFPALGEACAECPDLDPREAVGRLLTLGVLAAPPSHPEGE